MDKKSELKEKDDDSVYYNLDADDNITHATDRLFKPEKKAFFQFFSQYFNCFFRTKSDDALPEAEDSFAEPLPTSIRPTGMPRGFSP